MNRIVRSFVLALRNRHLLAVDLFLITLAPVGSLLLRLDNLTIPASMFPTLFLYVAIVLIWKPLLLYVMGLYDRYWPYASVDAFSTLAASTGLAWLFEVFIFFSVLLPWDLFPERLPRSLPIIDGVLTMLFVGGVRFTLRLLFETDKRQIGVAGAKPVLIAGAGAAGSLVVKELKRNPQLGLHPVGFLDDDTNKIGLRIQGVKVMGRLQDLPAAVKETGVREVVIAMPTAPGRVIRSVVQSCKDSNVLSQTIPGIFEILEGTAKVSNIRDVQIEDLLRRGVVQTDTKAVAGVIRGKRIMVTGAGGSIGSELCRQICALRPAEIALVGHGENSVFQIAGELQKLHPLMKTGTQIHSIIADMRDAERMSDILGHYKPHLIFHAAAHKHVGLMEANVPDAVSNNVMGTMTLVDLAERFAVERFVMISSDKAVNPTSVMGVTKRIAELIVHDAALRTGRAFVSVRFGNVLGSRGSVVPIFKGQIARGGPVCITHPDVTRFFMTIPEAVQLVLQAGALGKGGETFVLDMGEPIRILDLARDVIRLSGFEVGRDIEIIYTGLKRGEKLHEELFYESEHPERSAHEKMFVCRSGYRGPWRAVVSSGADGKLSVDLPPARETGLQSDIARLIQEAQRGNAQEIRRIIKSIVPEYQPDFQVEDSVQSIARQAVAG